ncbi:MAG: hypothetical protein A3B25_01185 [Candidatus Ryanbacteria bacterium RIFCSPLOWO2_01_FULL_48_26]|uniref:Uncharacterized protein n=1 Tax=Candidatus Ryanbacteria bacterium RIFCSPLOWO2_01_FULL_48_26 TaxID=1802126 RepID=A0A1G2GRJ8_9BACT|nr:MAG: hypothetical protein A3B25_01185 [Candidatus Ryanbacteria bacterium RIFCSPLOWO2_01_FULL_48_26]
MKIFVTSKPSAKRIGIQKIDETHFTVSVQEPPREGRANYAIAKALAKYFGIPTISVCLISGATSKQKIFEIS